jgi:hypothetical protein
MPVFDLSTPADIKAWLELFDGGHFAAAGPAEGLTLGFANWTWRVIL